MIVRSRKMQTMLSIILAGILASKASLADETGGTVVYGAAATSDGGQNVFVVNQPNNLENPLGNPLYIPAGPPKVFGHVQPETAINQEKSQTMPLQTNESPEQESISLGKDFQNTILEANDRVYDIQSYPKADFQVMENPTDPQTIYSPNVNGPQN